MPEEQIITTITAPRVSVKKGLKGNAVGWEIASSSSKDKEEIQKIIEMLKEQFQKIRLIKKENKKQ